MELTRQLERAQCAKQCNTEQAHRTVEMGPILVRAKFCRCGRPRTVDTEPPKARFVHADQCVFMASPGVHLERLYFEPPRKSKVAMVRKCECAQHLPVANRRNTLPPPLIQVPNGAGALCRL